MKNQNCRQLRDFLIPKGRSSAFAQQRFAITVHRGKQRGKFVAAISVNIRFVDQLSFGSKDHENSRPRSFSRIPPGSASSSPILLYSRDLFPFYHFRWKKKKKKERKGRTRRSSLVWDLFSLRFGESRTPREIICPRKKPASRCRAPGRRMTIVGGREK